MKKLKYFFLQKKTGFLIALGIIVLSAGSLFIKDLPVHRPASPKYNDEATYIPQQIHACAASSNKTFCVEDAAKNFTQRYTLPQIFTVFEQNDNDKDFFQLCHSTLHFIGQNEFKKIGSVSAALAAGNPVCFAGYYHGVLEGYLISQHLVPGQASNSQLLAEIPNLCVKPSTGADKNYNECLHGLGHALMYATDSDLPASLKLCDTLQGDSDQQWCYSGVFMENSTSSTNPDHPNQDLKPGDPLYPCDTLGSKYLNMCYTLQSFYFAQLVNYNWAKNFDWCYKVPTAYQDGCINAIGQSQVGFTQDFKIMDENCGLGSNPEQVTTCIQGAVGAINDRYNDGPAKMISFCGQVARTSQGACFERAFSTIQLQSLTAIDPKTFCSKISQISYENQCLESLSDKKTQ